jgi:AAA domain
MMPKTPALSDLVSSPSSSGKELDVTILTQKTLGGLPVRSVVEQTNFLNIMLYGDPGIGKTRLAGSASLVPEMSPVLFIDIEGGTLSLAQDYPKVDVVRVQSWEDMADIYSELFDDPTRYKTVVLDSLTETQKFSMDLIMEKAIQKNPDRDKEVPGMREWGINGEQIRRLVRAYRDMDLHVITTAHSMEFVSENGTSRLMPSLSGKLKREVAGFVDIVLYMETRKFKDADKNRYFATAAISQGTPDYVAKDRSGMLPEVMESPDMAEIYGYISGALEKSESEEEETNGN